MPPGVYVRSEETRRVLSESAKKRKSPSEEHRQKLSEAQKKRWIDREQRQRQSEHMKSQRSDPNSSLSTGLNTEETREKISKSVRKSLSRTTSVLFSEEWRSSRSRHMKLARADPNSPLNLGLNSEEVSRKIYFYGGYHNGKWMRCLNSEGVFARELDSVGIQWVYEPKRFKLSTCSYLPDFYLPEFDIWVEVKGWMDEVSQRKIDSFRSETGKTLVVVMQKELPTLLY